jgi:hypothetical protein
LQSNCAVDHKRRKLTVVGGNIKEAGIMTQDDNSQVKPRVFIGSSSAGLNVAYEIHKQLHKYVDVVVWDQEDWLGRVTLEHLMKILDDYNFAVLVFRPDDEIEIKGKKMMATRDNVLFELGLFMGKHGRDKTFIVFQDDSNSRVPTDLLGINFANYADGSTSDLVAACFTIRQRMLKIWEEEQKRAQEEKQKKGSADEPDPLVYEAGMLYRILNAASAPQYKAIDSDSLKVIPTGSVSSFADIESVQAIARELFRYYMFPFLKPRHTPPQRLRVYFAYYLGDGAPFEIDGGLADPHYCLGKDDAGNQIKGQFIIGISNPTESPEPNWMSGLPLKGYNPALKNKSDSNTAEAFKTRKGSLIENTDNPIWEHLNFKVENEKTVYSVPVVFSHKSWYEREWRAAIGVLTVSGSHPKMINDDIKRRADHLALLLGFIFYLHTKQSPDKPRVQKGIGNRVLPVGFDQKRMDDPDFTKFVRRVVSLRREIAAHFEQYFLENDVHRWNGKELSFVKSLS